MSNPTTNPEEQSFVKMLVSKVPNWTLGIIGSLLTFALVCKIIGIDFAGPINELTSAYVEVQKMESADVKRNEEFRNSMVLKMDEQRDMLASTTSNIERGMMANSVAIQSMEDSLSSFGNSLVLFDSRLQSYEDRLKRVEVDSHSPAHKN